MSVKIQFPKLLDGLSDASTTVGLEKLEPMFDSAQRTSEVAMEFDGLGGTLVLGAGVSASCGVVTWNELLLSLYSKFCMPVVDGNLSELIRIYGRAMRGYGPLIGAGTAANGAGSDSDVKEYVRELLYRQAPTGKHSSLTDALARLVKKLSDRTNPSIVGRGGRPS